MSLSVLGEFEGEKVACTVVVLRRVASMVGVEGAAEVAVAITPVAKDGRTDVLAAQDFCFRIFVTA